MLAGKLLLVVLVGQTTGEIRSPSALVEKLGAETHAAREAAMKLESLGSEALPALHAALKSSDPEIRSCAIALLRTIKGSILLHGTKVRLDFQDAPAAAVLESLNNQAGSELRLGQPMPKSGEPRVTLRDAKPVSLWNAIDRFCEASDLVCDDQFGALPALPLGFRGLSFSYQPEHAKVPSYDYGAFRIKVVMVSYHNELSYFPGVQAADRIGTSIHEVTMKNPRARKELLPENPEEARRRNRVQESRNTLDRTVRFRVELQIVPDRRMEISFNGPPELLEAVDELGNSLLPTSGSEKNGYFRAWMMAGGMIGSPDGPASVFLHRPQHRMALRSPEPRSAYRVWYRAWVF
jgi:hypothetical protein